MEKKESKNFKQLDVINRTKLQAFIESKYTASQITKELNVARQTIYRKIKRNVLIISTVQPWNLKPTVLILKFDMFFYILYTMIRGVFLWIQKNLLLNV